MSSLRMVVVAARRIGGVDVVRRARGTRVEKL